MKRFIFVAFAVLSFVCFAQTSKETVSNVNMLKASIPYPKYNIGDTLYIAFVNDPNVSTDAIHPSDVVVIKARIVEIMLYNTIGGQDFHLGVYLSTPVERFPLKWQYQFVDTTIQNPKYRDFSVFQDEDRFFTNPEDAALSLINAY